jgi:hypothetical protein
MYRTLQPLRQALSQQLKADLFPAGAGIDPNRLLQTYLDWLEIPVSGSFATRFGAEAGLNG